MDYYNYQILNSGAQNETPQASLPNLENGTSSQYCYGNYVYQALSHTDPRLNNYICYNPISAATTSLQVPSQIYDVSVQKLVPTLEIKTDDELWIETWLSKIGKIQINLNSAVEIQQTTSTKQSKSKKNTIMIHTAKHLLKNSLQVIDTLEHLQEFLKANAATMSPQEWKAKTTEVGHIKDQFSKLLLPFENQEIMNNLQKSVERRRRKRENLKRLKKQRSQRLKQIHDDRRKMHKAADLWLENKREEVEKTKQEEKLKMNADCVLAEVTKKKGDARKLLTLITTLVKLRQVREHATLQRGEKVSLEDHTAFAKATDHLTKIWESALQEYTKEEQDLRKMLEQNASEDNIAAQAAKEKQIVGEWEMAIFGPRYNPLPSSWSLTVAERDLETFIAIRKSWDTFLVEADDENGSHIPIGWVMPNPSALGSWTKYCG